MKNRSRRSPRQSPPTPLSNGWKQKQVSEGGSLSRGELGERNRRCRGQLGLVGCTNKGASTAIRGLRPSSLVKIPRTVQLDGREKARGFLARPHRLSTALVSGTIEAALYLQRKKQNWQLQMS